MRSTRTPNSAAGYVHYVPPMQSEAFAVVPRRPTAESARGLRRRIAWFLGLAAAATVTLAALASPALDVRRIEVRGASAFPGGEADAILRVSALPARTSIVRLRLKDVRRRLEGLPFVASASVSRGLPTTVRIVVHPRHPVAEFCLGGARWEIDGTGTPIRAADARSGRPVVESARVCAITPGVPLPDLETREAVRVIALGGVPESPGISKIVVDPMGELCLNMADGVTVKLGHVEGLRDKLTLVRRMYAADRAIAATVATISVRYPQAPVCEMRKPASDTSPAAAATASRNRRAQPPSSATTP